jgi:hypothetical protein
LLGVFAGEGRLEELCDRKARPVPAEAAVPTTGSLPCSPRPPGRRGGYCAAAVVVVRGSEHNSCTAWTSIKLNRWLRWLGSSWRHEVGPIRCLAEQIYSELSERHGKGADAQGLKLSSQAIGLFQVCHGYCFGGCHCRLDRRRLGALLNELGVFAGEGRLEELCDRKARPVAGGGRCTYSGFPAL